MGGGSAESKVTGAGGPRISTELHSPCTSTGSGGGASSDSTASTEATSIAATSGSEPLSEIAASAGAGLCPQANAELATTRRPIENNRGADIARRYRLWPRAAITDRRIQGPATGKSPVDPRCSCAREPYTDRGSWALGRLCPRTRECSAGTREDTSDATRPRSARCTRRTAARSVQWRSDRARPCSCSNSLRIHGCGAIDTRPSCTARERSGSSRDRWIGSSRRSFRTALCRGRARRGCTDRRCTTARRARSCSRAGARTPSRRPLRHDR